RIAAAAERGDVLAGFYGHDLDAVCESQRAYEQRKYPRDMRAVAVRSRAVRDVGIVVHGVAPHDIPDRVAQEHVVVRARAEYLRVGIHPRVYDRDDHGLKLGKVVFRTQPRKDDARL